MNHVNWKELIAGWNAGDENLRNKLIEEMMPVIKKHGVVNYDNALNVNTPMKWFSEDEDTIQDIYEHFLNKANFVKFSDKNDVFRFFTVTTHRYINDKIKVTINNARPNYRVPLDQISNMSKIVDNGAESSEAKVEMEEALSIFSKDKRYKDQATAFYLVNIFNQSVEETAKIMEVNDRTIYRYLDLAKLKLFSLIKSKEGKKDASF